MSELSAALVKAQREMSTASKDAKNPFFKSKYADLNSIREAVMPALNTNGIVVLQPTVYIDGKSFVRTILRHVSGEEIFADAEIIVAKQNDPQSWGAALSYARRYALQSFMCVGAEDDDAETAMGRSAPKKAPEKEEAVAPAAKPTFRASRSTKTAESGDLI